MADWIIYYAGGEKFSSDNGHARDAPSRGVVAVWARKGIGGSQKRVAEKCAFFVYDLKEDQWYDSDYIGMVDRLLLRQDKALIKLGRYVPDDVWQMIRKEAELSDGRH